MHRPLRRQLFLPGQDFFHQYIGGLAVAGKKSRQPLQVLGRIPEAVDVVDPHAGDDALLQQRLQQPVRFVEDLRPLHVHAHQRVDGEEAAVVDLVDAALPEREPIVLLLQDVVQVVERRGPARRAVDGAQHLGEVVLQVFLFHQPFQLAAQRIALLHAGLGRLHRILRRPGRQGPEMRGELLQLLRHLLARVAKPRQSLEQRGIRKWAQRETQVAVADAEGAVLVLEGGCRPPPARGRRSRPASRHQDAVLQRGTGGDSSECRRRARNARCVAVLQHIEPAPVERPLDAHVIRHEVGQQSHPRARAGARLTFRRPSIPPSSGFTSFWSHTS